MPDYWKGIFEMAVLKLVVDNQQYIEICPQFEF